MGARRAVEMTTPPKRTVPPSAESACPASLFPLVLKHGPGAVVGRGSATQLGVARALSNASARSCSGRRSVPDTAGALGRVKLRAGADGDGGRGDGDDGV